MFRALFTLLCIGAGGRGTTYCSFALEQPDRLQVVGVAEPRELYRQRLVTAHKIAPQFVFNDWREAAKQPKLADAVIIATQDAMHAEPAMSFFMSRMLAGGLRSRPPESKVMPLPTNASGFEATRSRGR